MVAAKYHTGRFTLVTALREELAVPVSADRHPCWKWEPGPEPAEEIVEQPGDPIRIGYAHCSTAQQDLDVQTEARCRTIFSEKISSRGRTRPEFEKALALARQFKDAAPDQRVIFTVHEYKRPARTSAELMTVTADLQATGVELELLTGQLSGIYDPNGAGELLFAVLAHNAQLDRNYIREKTLEGQQLAAAKGNHGGWPRVLDDDQVAFARSLRAAGVPVPEIAKKVRIISGKNAGHHLSVASVYRVLTDTP